MSSRLLTVAELAQQLGLHHITVYKMIHQPGFIQPIRIGRRAIRFRQEDVDAWLQAQANAAA